MSYKNEFAERVVLVTGAASGIGRAAMHEYGKLGATVVGADLNGEGGQQAAHEVIKAGGKAEFIQANLAEEDEVQTLVEGIAERHGRLDAAFNNAGIFGASHPLSSYPKADWDAVIAVNLSAVFLALRFETAQMLRQGYGAIVNTSSVGGLTGPATMAAYAASKAGVIALTRVAAMEHARFGIRVNAIAPGFTYTPMNNTAQGVVNGFESGAIADTPMNRGADPVEIARTAVWLTSDDASFVLGQTLAVDGGYTIGGSVLEHNPIAG